MIHTAAAVPAIGVTANDIYVDPAVGISQPAWKENHVSHPFLIVHVTAKIAYILKVRPRSVQPR